MPGSGLWTVKVDPSQIDQILANLCINSRIAIEGVGKITVETENSTLDEEYSASHLDTIPGEYVRITVSDNGCGMDKLTLSHIFEPFFTTKDLGEGTGLGLATVFGAVKQNNGFINVYSEPGQGTSFTIYLPRYLDIAAQQKSESAMEPAALGHETVLLVEDESTILKMTTTMRQLLGYTVLTASSPDEAIRRFSEFTKRSTHAYNRYGYAWDERSRPCGPTSGRLPKAEVPLYVRLYSQYYLESRSTGCRGAFHPKTLLPKRTVSQSPAGADG